MLKSPPPLGLYVHLPWCTRKCPYCDFNSYAADAFAEDDYIDALLNDLEQELPLVWGRSTETIFIGGGTPSLFSGAAIGRLLSGLRALLNFAPAIEVTLEANPGSADADRFRAYHEHGINRLSLGVQSFDDRQLETLGRVHRADEALRAYDAARAAGFDNVNIDLMFGLPQQTLEQAMADVEQAIALAPEHISHYQLTLEPNTLFHSLPPPGMPDDDLAWSQQQACGERLSGAGYRQYEVSAWASPERASQHNLNYWSFGDYIGIGAGAHGKLTLVGEQRILRRERQRQPRRYLEHSGQDRILRERELTRDDLRFEFMLNALRLKDGFAARLFHENTGLSLNELLDPIKSAQNKGLLDFDGEKIVPTEQGFRFLNDLQMIFLENDKPRMTPIFESGSGIMHN